MRLWRCTIPFNGLTKCRVRFDKVKDSADLEGAGLKPGAYTTASGTLEE